MNLRCQLVISPRACLLARAHTHTQTRARAFRRYVLNYDENATVSFKFQCRLVQIEASHRILQGERDKLVTALADMLRHNNAPLRRASSMPRGSRRIRSLKVSPRPRRRSSTSSATEEAPTTTHHHRSIHSSGVATTSTVAVPKGRSEPAPHSEKSLLGVPLSQALLSSDREGESSTDAVPSVVCTEADTTTTTTTTASCDVIARARLPTSRGTAPASSVCSLQ
jgi:hypothetical protein